MLYVNSQVESCTTIFLTLQLATQSVNPYFDWTLFYIWSRDFLHFNLGEGYFLSRLRNEYIEKFLYCFYFYFYIVSSQHLVQTNTPLWACCFICLTWFPHQLRIIPTKCTQNMWWEKLKITAPSFNSVLN